jgi:hypothetical protein
MSNIPKLGVGLSYHHKSRNIASLKDDAGYTYLIGVMP